MIEFANENEREFAAAAEQLFAESCTAARCHELITDSLISFRHAAAVQARREALRVVNAGPVQP
jgi:hypothetical protein